MSNEYSIDKYRKQSLPAASVCFLFKKKHQILFLSAFSLFLAKKTPLGSICLSVILSSTKDLSEGI